MEINFLFFIFISYLVGSIPFAYLLTKIFGYGDIRKIGSGNVGATNVLRTGKKSLAIIVLLLDIIKGFLPITIISLIFSNQIQSYEAVFLGSFSIIGHIFPIWLKFQGGKGVATYIGFILGINFTLAIICVLSWLTIAFIKKYSSLASILSLILIPISSFFLRYNLKITIIITILSILIIIKHYPNIKRLLSNSENKIRL